MRTEVRSRAMTHAGDCWKPVVTPADSHPRSTVRSQDSRARFRPEHAFRGTDCVEKRRETPSTASRPARCAELGSSHALVTAAFSAL